MNFSRREFLGLLAAAAAGGAWAGLRRYRAARGGRTRYYVPSPELYWHERQDFSAFAAAPALVLPGLPGSFRSLLTVSRDDGSENRRAFVPGLIHSVLAGGDRVFLVTVDAPTALYAIDAAAAEIVAVAAAPAGGYVFGGHVLPFGPDHLLVTLNAPRAGVYDSVGVFHRETLREESRFSSGGFQAHDLALSPSGHLFVGHYGSYLGSGPYASEARTTPSNPRPGSPRAGAYPSCVSVLDPLSGKLLRRIASAEPGPLGHLAVDAAEDVFITAVAPRLAPRAGGCAHRAFAEGPRHEEDFAAFAPSLYNSGTSILNDEEHGEVLVTQRSQGKLLFTGHAPGAKTGALDLAALDPSFGLANGLRFHPDGRHLVVSTNHGFLVFERGSHRFRRELSFAADLKVHSHFDLLQG
jgi:hypothetical protein